MVNGANIEGQRGITAMLRCLFLCSTGAVLLAAGEPAETGGDEAAIAAQLETIRSAALESQPERTAEIFAEDLVLVSQSGKVYGKEAALLDLGNGFEAWDNSELDMRVAGSSATITYINSRTRTDMEPARFRVMQVWHKRDAGWQVIAQSSVRLPAQQ